MKQKLSFIALGQAGGNIGKLLEQKGFSVLYLNTSLEDLNTLENVKYKYHITGGEGCNKDRKKAKQLLIEDFDNIMTEIETTLGTELIFVIFASGGGTGSGCAPMLIDLLLDEGKRVGSIVILPSIEESIKAQMNAYECFGELIQIKESASCFIIDNTKGEKMVLNQQAVEDICSFLSIPERYQSKKGNIDWAEIEESLCTHGMSTIIQAQGKSSANLIQQLQQNEFAMIEHDQVIKYITAVLASESILPDLEKIVGNPLDRFLTYTKEQTICCLLGLSYPESRFEQMYQKVEEEKERIAKNLIMVTESKLEKNINFLEEIQPKKVEKDVVKKTRRDIMNKYL